MSVLYYAIGGGLGHLTRARAVLESLFCASQATLLTASPYADDPRVVGDIPVLRPPADDRSQFRSWVRDTIARLAPERIIVDTFPAGLFGEIEAPKVDYVARYLRWDKYEARDLPQFDRTWVLEELQEEHRRVIDERSVEVISDRTFDDAPPRDIRTPPLPRSFVLIVHSGPAEEIAELVGYAIDVCGIEAVGEPIVLCAPPALHRPDLECVDVYPATLIASDAVRIFTGGGYNAMRQFAGDSRHRPLPFARRFDDQYLRVARARSVGLRRACVTESRR